MYIYIYAVDSTRKRSNAASTASANFYWPIEEKKDANGREDFMGRVGETLKRTRASWRRHYGASGRAKGAEKLCWQALSRGIYNGMLNCCP